MSGRGKRKGNAASDEDAGSQVAGESIECCELSKHRKVSVRKWKGSIIVDIREFYTKDGKTFPGKKGIALPLEQWEVLRSHIDKIDEALSSVQT